MACILYPITMTQHSDCLWMKRLRSKESIANVHSFVVALTVRPAFGWNRQEWNEFIRKSFKWKRMCKVRSLSVGNCLKYFRNTFRFKLDYTSYKKTKASLSVPCPSWCVSYVALLSGRSRVFHPTAFVVTRVIVALLNVTRTHLNST